MAGDSKLTIAEEVDPDGDKAVADAKEVGGRGRASSGAAKGSKEVWSKEADYY